MQYPPPPRPTVHDAHEDDITESDSGDESYDESDGEMGDDARDNRAANVGKPRDLGFQGPAQGRPEMARPPGVPGQQPPSRDEIRKMIKEECMTPSHYPVDSGARR